MSKKEDEKKKEFVLEFLVSHITCKNLNAASSPLFIKVPTCAPIEMDPRTVTLTRITFEKGRRLIFAHDRLLDLNSTFELHFGHGNPQVRGSCSVDFFEVSNGIDENAKKLYDIDVAMQRPDRSHFGILHLTFQIFTVRELEEARALQKPQNMVSPRTIVKPLGTSRGSYSGSYKGRGKSPKRSLKSMSGKRIDAQ